jgi:hypothetical protein
MFKMIQTFYNPKSLAVYLFGRMGTKGIVADRDSLLCAVDLMRYTSKRPNQEAYLMSKDYILQIAFAQQRVSGDKKYDFRNELLDALYLATEYSTNENVRPLCYDNLVSQIFYNIYSKGCHGESNYHTIWRALCRMMGSENTEWFQQYWVGAVQYYSFVLENLSVEATNSEDETERGKKSRFLELHYALGAMLVYQGKYDWLRFTLTYDHTLPHTFKLIPSSVTEIVYVVINMESQCLFSWKLTSKYLMNGMVGSAESDNRIIEWVYRYSALLLIRLFSYNDYNIRYNNPMALPYVEALSLSELKGLKSTAERLRNEVVDYWFEGGRIKKMNLTIVPEPVKVTDLMDGVIQKVNEKIQFREENPELDKDKFIELQSLLCELDNKEKPVTDLPMDEERKSWEKSSVPIRVETKLSVDLCSKDGYRGWSNFPNVLLQGLRLKIERYIEGRYSLLTPVADLWVCERSIFNVLEKLNIPDGYTILTMGVYLGGVDLKYNAVPVLKYDWKNENCQYGQNPVIECNSSMSALFILKSDELIKVETNIESENKFRCHGMEPLPNSKYGLYTNIDQIMADNNPAPIIKIGKIVNLYCKGDIRFIRVRVKQNGEDASEVAGVRRLVEYI